MILPPCYIGIAMERYPVLVGYKCGVTPPPENGKAPTLTTELAHRTNSYGLPHVLIFEPLYEKEH